MPAVVEAGGAPHLPGAHPVAIAIDGVDLAVVRDQRKRLRHRPRGKRIRTETLMGDGEGGGAVAAPEVAVERTKVERANERFVNDCPVAQRGHEEIGGARIRVDRATGAEKLLLETIQRRRHSGDDKDLFDPRHAGARLWPKYGLIDWNSTPSGNNESLGSDRLFDDAPGPLRGRLP